MLEGGKVSNRQMAFLITIVVMATIVLFVPAIVAASAKHDGWLSVLVVATAYGLLVALVVVKLALRFPGQTVVEYAPQILGTFLGKLVGLGYIFWFIHVNATVVREFGDFLLSAFMPETPLVAFNIIILALAAWAVKSGLEVICRASEWVTPLFFISLFAIVLLVLPAADFSNLLPFMEEGMKPILRGGLAPAAWRGEIVLMLMFIPYLNSPRQVGGYLAASVVFVGVLLAIVTMVSSAVFGDLVENLVFPFHDVASYVFVAHFLGRTEGLTLGMWVAGETIKVSAFYYASVLGAAQLFGLKSYGSLIIPIGVILAALSMSLFENTRELVAWLSSIFPAYAYTFELLLPSLLLAVAMLRHKGTAKNV